MVARAIGTRFRDGLQNFLTGIGFGGDKGAPTTSYGLRMLSPQQIDAAYRCNWIVRKAIDIPAQDSFREWREWQADKKDITKVEETEKLFNMQQKSLKAMKLGRLMGGGALIIGTDDEEDMMLPLNMKKIKQGSLKFLHAVSRNHLHASGLIYNVDSEWYGRPEWYEQRAFGTVTQTIRLHPSRVIPFMGSEVIDALDKNEPWSDPMLMVIDDAVKSAGLSIANITHMINEAKLDVIRTPELTEQVSSDEGERKLTKRFVYANTMKSTINAIILDKEEEWQRIQIAFAGMPEVVHVFLLIASAAVDVPSTRFLSQSPKGLNATGDSDLHNYYDSRSSAQKNEITPAITPLDEVLVRSSLGTYPDGVHYNWRPLWLPTETEKADTALKKAQAFQIHVNSMLINEDALREGICNQLIEDGVYPGLEDAIEEFGNEPSEPEVDPALIAAQKLLAPPNARQIANQAKKPPPLALPKPAKGKDSLRIGDSLPRPLYVRRDLLPACQTQVINWAVSQGIPKDKVLTDMHVTIIYSRDPVDWMKLGADDWGNEDGLVVAAGGPRIIEKFGEGAIVLSFASNRLRYRHESMCAEGCSHDYDGYQPHITLTYDLPDFDLSKIEPYRGELRFGPEIFELPKAYDPNDPSEDDEEDDDE